MSRRIVYLFAVAACATLAAPAGADPECFDGVCRMPEVIEPPEAPAIAAEEPSVASATPQPAEPQRLGPAPEPIRPQMRVDDLPRPALRPLPQRPIEQAKSKPELARQAPGAVVDQPSEPVEVVSRRYELPAYATSPQYVQPNAGVVIVAPGAQYGEDGIAIANAPQDSSWRLCQGAGPHGRCIQYNYQPYGVYGYRPLGSYRAYRPSPGYVYVPDAKVITLD